MIDNEFVYYAKAKKFRDVTEFKVEATESESTFNLVQKIPIKNIAGVSYEQEKNQTTCTLFWYNSKNKEEEYPFLFQHGYDFTYFVDIISSKASLKKKEVIQTPLNAIKYNLLTTLVLVALTALWFSNSLADYNGENISIGHGKSALLSGIGILLGRKITPWGILILGSALSLLAFYFLVKKYKNPPVDIRFEKY